LRTTTIVIRQTEDAHRNAHELASDDTIRNSRAGDMADRGCFQCGGLGILRGAVCRCVWTAMFRECNSWFRRYVEIDHGAGSVQYGRPQGPQNTRAYGMRSAEYIADFLHLATTHLPTIRLRAVFTARYVLGADAKMVMRRYKLPRWEYYRIIGEIESTLGRAFALTQPYPIWPPQGY
jgi:hypothetical protein